MDINAIAEKIDKHGLQRRDSQLEMIQSVSDAILADQIICIEAATGTGKTLSYGIAGLLAKKQKQIIVVSTATIALQEQLVSQDIPLLEKILDTSINCAIAKGRQRYICHHRLYNDEHEGDLFSPTSKGRQLKSLLEAGHWRGDKDTLPFSMIDSDWKKVSTDSAGCIGSRCAFIDDCVYHRVKKRMYKADIVITNHSLLLSDLELGGGVVLPAIEDSIYIIDECHHLPDKALSHFSKSASIKASIDWINTLNKSVNKAQQLGFSSNVIKDNSAVTKLLVKQLTEMYDLLDVNLSKFENDIWHIQHAQKTLNIAGQAIFASAQKISIFCTKIMEYLGNAYDESKISSPDKAVVITKLMTTVGFVLDRSENLAATWQLFCHTRQKDEAPIATWIVKKSSKGERDYTFHASSISAAVQLQKLLWDKLENAMVLCSATVRAMGKFDDFLRRAGLRDNKKVVTKSVISPFNYGRSVLFVPAMCEEPRGDNPHLHLAEASRLLPELILPNSGTLVLFTSRRAMEKTVEALPMDLLDDVIVQDGNNKSRLIDQHKRQIKCGKRSILFGLVSFGEGLDLPAEYCQHVIIHKLPFAVPNDPIELTRSEWLRSNQKNAFMLSTLPQTSIKLTQYVGRLIRKESDYGIVTILDKRLYSKPYGAQLVSNLPSFQSMLNCSYQQLKENPSIKHLYMAV